MNTLESRIKSLKKNEREEFEAAKRRGYLIDRSRIRDELNLAYMTWCDITGAPFIAVSTEGVRFWLSSGSSTLSSQGTETIMALFRKCSWLEDDAEEYNSVGGNFGQAKAILPNDRELLAREMFLALRRLDTRDTSMRNIDRSMFPPDFSVPLPLEHTVVAWVKDQAIPHGWSQLPN